MERNMDGKSDRTDKRRRELVYGEGRRGKKRIEGERIEETKADGRGSMKRKSTGKR